MSTFSLRRLLRVTRADPFENANVIAHFTYEFFLDFAGAQDWLARKKLVRSFRTAHVRFYNKKWPISFASIENKSFNYVTNKIFFRFKSVEPDEVNKPYN